MNYTWLPGDRLEKLYLGYWVDHGVIDFAFSRLVKENLKKYPNHFRIVRITGEILK